MEIEKDDRTLLDVAETLAGTPTFVNAIDRNLCFSFIWTAHF
jgi:hypothetical protein